MHIYKLFIYTYFNYFQAESEQVKPNSTLANPLIEWVEHELARKQLTHLITLSRAFS